MHTSQQALSAYAAAVQALASAGVRNLASQEFDDEEVGALVIHVDRDGSVEVTLHNVAGHPVGGYTL